MFGFFKSKPNHDYLDGEYFGSNEIFRNFHTKAVCALREKDDSSLIIILAGLADSMKTRGDADIVEKYQTEMRLLTNQKKESLNVRTLF